jgi:hypothetical protein
MVEWSRTAANFLRAVGRAYPQGAPTEVEALTDELWKLASRAATLAGALDTLSKTFEQLQAAGAGLRADLERKIEALAGEESAESRKQIEALRGDLDRFTAALEVDSLAGRQRIETRVHEALALEKAFTETSSALVEHLRNKRGGRELLEEIAKGPPSDDKAV